MDRVFREMEAADASPPLITDDYGVVAVTLYAAKETALPDVLADTELNERQVKALAIIAQRGPINNQEYRVKFGVSHTTATADLRDLVAKGLIERVGTGRGTHYCLVDDLTKTRMT